MFQDPFKYDFGLRRYRLHCRAPDSSQISTPCLTKTMIPLKKIDTEVKWTAAARPMG